MVLTSPASVVRKHNENLDLRPPAGRKVRETTTVTVLVVATALALVVLGTLIIDILIDGSGRLSLDFLTTYTSRDPDVTGIRAGLTGTLSLMVLVALMTFPVGVGAAVYLEEFAPNNRITRLLETNINNLAGVPSVIYGLMGLSIFIVTFGLGRSLIAGALTLTLLVLPVVIVASREALRSVPREIRSGGLALGATPIQVAFRQTLPAAIPGVMTGTILALSRAIGETAPILVAGAVFSRRADNEPWNLSEAYTAIPIQIYDFIKRPQAEFQIEVAAAAIIVLMALLLLMNSTAIFIRNRYTRTY
ncbi:phosphate ABC transporter permease PstA [Aquipuribacter sp. MA13-6]|uniref:phosphate ABC transporter permease PstA n=1 Tax=unclassified Aquipuribacter TaxID=2635084 RepID=UPI003EEF751D